MPKVKNVGAGIYANGLLYLSPGEEAEVSESEAKYLCSDECPGKLELVKPEAAKPAKGAKG